MKKWSPTLGQFNLAFWRLQHITGKVTGVTGYSRLQMLPEYSQSLRTNYQISKTRARRNLEQLTKYETIAASKTYRRTELCLVWGLWGVVGGWTVELMDSQPRFFTSGLAARSTWWKHPLPPKFSSPISSCTQIPPCQPWVHCCDIAC